MITQGGADRLAVVGAGTMGTGITTLAVGHGVPVTLVDLDDPTLVRARAGVRNGLREARLMATLPDGVEPAAVETTTDLDRIAGASAVVEAVTERPEAKLEVLGRATDLLAPGAPLISNTSGIPIGELAASLRVPGRLVGAHFMNPCHLIGMVEVSRGPDTDDATVAAVTTLLRRLRRTAVTVHDSPGFVTSRLLHPMINQAAALVGAGVATADDVDRLMQGCLGHPTGPLRTADVIGLDNLVDSLEAIHRRTGSSDSVPAATLRELVDRGCLGRKSGRGFYPYTPVGGPS